MSADLQAPALQAPARREREKREREVYARFLTPKPYTSERPFGIFPLNLKLQTLNQVAISIPVS
jgi:hypothetical protein